jgi:hypothetical protein
MRTHNSFWMWCGVDVRLECEVVVNWYKSKRSEMAASSPLMA